jgi:cyclopropane-fatty-acyl-phospholipid synthase
MMMPFLIDAAEKGWIPDSLIRVAIRHLLRQRLKQDRYHATVGGKRTFVEAMREVPLAVATDEANEQHYEVPSEFFVFMLGPHLKYSSAWYPKAGSQLGEAEAAMLDVTMDRAAIEDGQSILELGCGWGSLTLAMAARFKNSQITAVSNSASQKAYIDGEASARGLGNISVITADMRSFEIDQTFDRVVSVEMFEHMRNYEELFRRIKGWLNPKGKLFFHIFCHRNQPYFFEDQGDGDWMARHFFTGGLMPSFDLPSHFQRDLSLEASWAVNGQHYAQTCAHWLENLDQHREPMLKALGRGQHPDAPQTQWQRWRMFVMACEALFAHEGGETWFVGHFLMAPKI